MTGAGTEGVQLRHDCKWSEPIIELLQWRLDPEHPAPIVGPFFDPFAGIGHGLDRLPVEVRGIEIESEWANANPLVEQGDALRWGDYPAELGCVVTSPTYGNRMADQYPGPPCPKCRGLGRMLADGTAQPDPPDPELTSTRCDECDGRGINPDDKRYGYAPSLARPVSAGSSARLQWGRGYQDFHRQWLRTLDHVLPHGERRLIVNMADHVRKGERKHVVAWWIVEAYQHGFPLAECHPVDTMKMGYGQNHDARTGGEVVMVFDHGR